MKKLLRRFWKRLLGSGDTANEVVTRDSVKARLTQSWFTKERTPGRNRVMHDRLMDLSVAQQHLAFTTWPDTAMLLTHREWTDHKDAWEKLEKSKK